MTRRFFRMATGGAQIALLGVAFLMVGQAGPTLAGGQDWAGAPSDRFYDAYVPTASKEGQFFYYTCEFDAAWVVLKTFGHDVPLAEQLEIVGHDTSVKPVYEETATGFVIYGGDITAAYNGDYTNDFLARTTGQAMQPLFEAFDLEVRPIADRSDIERTLDGGGLVWIKATVDFLPWAPTTWITPDGTRLPTVLGNDHSVVVMGYDDEVVVIRDPLGPTDTNWGRQYEYEVPWDTFLPVWAAQGNDGLAVFAAGDTADFPDPGDGGLSGIEIGPVGGGAGG